MTIGRSHQMTGETDGQFHGPLMKNSRYLNEPITRIGVILDHIFGGCIWVYLSSVWKVKGSPFLDVLRMIQSLGTVTQYRLPIPSARLLTARRDG